ncbi:Metallo-dependent hydrolase [Aspergillus heteromorphus CBS 117.55]|uniref:Metallo-dependent hydrolase n=1 Tax=Aspergillus heteromorphus CBS 117.55 TaxID=1448321 RepID=A0A317WAY5_9EURO|nr:Metallo-dependent hydrolase [Aspergillus heteromorphus CBS 117.55]PWY82951.1 Metallo-dependent hydrolase [Aspergillus heteromorphus CBS 117.55]
MPAESSNPNPNPTPKDDFPWHLGVFDAHCHPTDTMSSIGEIPQMKATTLTVMSTRGEDQDLVLQTAASLTKDQNATQGLSAAPGPVLPCFGWHPWFSYQIIDDVAGSPAIDEASSPAERKKLHYKKVLTPAPDDDFILSLPDPKPISQLLSESRARLTECPNSLVGEVGLDRSFRLPKAWTQEEKERRDEQMTPGSREGRQLSPYRVQLEHQKSVLKAQLRLAGDLQRPVSVHSVQAHGAVFDIFKALWSGHERKAVPRRDRCRRYSVTNAHAESDAEEEQAQEPGKPEETPLPFPPRICMHSYSGPVEPLKQFLNPSHPSDVYFSFSSVINFSGPSSQKVIDVIKALPEDRILIESDLHTAGQQMDDLLEEVARQICEIRGWALHDGVQRLADNWKRFVFGEKMT